MRGHSSGGERGWRPGIGVALAGCLLLLFLGTLTVSAQVITIEKIEWEGLRRIPRDTMNARILSKPGDPYDPSVLERDFRAVWNTNFFEDVRLEVEDGEKGKIVYFIVVERPLIRRIEYEGLSSVTQSEVLERFRERRVNLTVEMQYDPTRVRQAEVALKELLSERGRHFANVGTDLRRIPPNAVILTFVVEEGPKVKVGRVSFQGNRRFSDRRLLRAMKGSRPYGIPYLLPLMGKTYNGDKLAEDLERVRELYQEYGYFRVVVHPAETRMRNTDPVFPLSTMSWWFKPGKAADLRIQVEEGARYRMGKLIIRSATGTPEDPGRGLFFKGEFLRLVFPLKEGDILNVTKVRKALEDYRKLFSEWGFINMNTIPDTTIDDNTRTVDLTLEFEQNKQFFVHRIEFVGNTTTRDKVIRRELLLEEGSMFNSRLWEYSIIRLNQLGYFEELRPEGADVQQNAEQGTVDLTLKVKEKGKNSIGLSGGMSGVLGSFVGLNYATNNFLGLGETLSLDLEYGDRQKAILFGFTEPYLFDRPLQTGFSVFVRRFEFDQARESTVLTGQTLFIDPSLQNRLVNYIQDSTGFSLFASYPLKRRRWTRIGLTYGFDISDIKCLTEGCSSLFEGLAFRGFAGPSALRGIRSSRITPTYLYDSTNHPLFPTRGTSIFLSGTWEGGPLGGNQKTIRPAFEIKHFRPINHGRNTLAFRLLAAFVSGYGGQLPSPFTRFYIGGEDTVRGFDIRAVSPLAFVPIRASIPVVFLDPTRLDPNGNPTVRFTVVEALNQTISVPGGDTEVIGNFEYRIPLAGPVTLAPFLDAGINPVLRPSQLRLTAENLAELRAAFPTARIPDNLDIVRGTNLKLRSSAGLELVINLPVVNAPFRIYWAYNLTRLNKAITVPASIFRVAPGITLPPGVFETQIQPLLGVQFQERTILLREPPKTFRFTISRTF